MVSQIKAVAEMINFKLCSIQLKSGGVKESSQQFRHHMKMFGDARSHFLWHDHSWAANQYLIYVGLLTHYSINTNHTDADRSYYYHRAALCTQKRYECFHGRQRSNSVDEASALHKIYSSMTTAPSTYFGSAPTFVPLSNANTSKLTASVAVPQDPPNAEEMWNLFEYSQVLAEEEVNHTDEILALLQKSLKNMNPLHKRRKSHIRGLIAKQLMSIGDYDMASAHLSSLIDYLHREQWSFCAIPILRKKILCATYLGRPREYVPAALKLYKIAVLDEFVETEDRMLLHKDLMSIIRNTEKPTQEYLENIRDSKNETSVDTYVSLPLRPEYGAAAIVTHPPEYFLPDSYTVELGDLTNGLFQIDVSYEQKEVEVGHHVKTRISIISLFQDVIKFMEMIAYFTEDVITQKFIHTDSEGHEETPSTKTDGDGAPVLSTSNISHASLEFHPSEKKEFCFDLFISEESLHKNEINYVCLERLLMKMSVPLPTQTSGEEIDTIEDDQIESEEEVLDSIDIEESLQAIIQEEAMDTTALQQDERDLPPSTLALKSEFTVKLEDNVVTEEDVNIEIEEESLDVNVSEQFTSHDIEDENLTKEKKLQEFNESDSDNDAKNSDNDDDEEETEYINESHDTEDRDERDTGESDNDGRNHDSEDDITPVTSPSKPHIINARDEKFEENNNSLHESPATIHQQQSTESVEEDVDDDDEDIDPKRRMSTSRLGVAVADLNKLDPVMPVVVDREMQKSRSRSSSLTPSYVAELMSPSTLNANIQSAHLSVDFRQSESSIDGQTTPSSTPHHQSRTMSLPPKLVTKNLVNESMRERGYREILFNSFALSKLFREARTSNFGTPGRVKEIADFLDIQNAPNLLTITPPISYVQLLSPIPDTEEPICILQGTIQRLNLIFSSGNHKMLQGKVYLKSNYHELRSSIYGGDSDGHFFWYPNTDSFSKGDGAKFSRTQSELDAIFFHPFSTDTESKQPVHSMQICDQDLNSIFACPVFIKSDIQGDLNLTVRVEYVPSIFLNNAIFKEFNLKIQVLKPFGMNFNISSLSDPYCGAEKRQGTSNVLRGDVINMAASLDCVNSLDSDVEVLVMQVMTKNASMCVNQDTGESVEMPVFKLAPNTCSAVDENNGNDNSYDLLKCGVAHLPSRTDDPKDVTKSYITKRDGENQTVVLQKGEAYVGSADLQCLNLDNIDSSLGMKYHELLFQANAVVSASMGDIIINWRINDSTFFQPADTAPYETDANRSESDSVLSDPSSWLLPLSNEPQDIAPLNTKITHTRVCNMLFSVPKVQIINAPFSVQIESPTVVEFGQTFTVHLKIFNKLKSLERMVMVAELSGEFLMTGGTFQAIEIAPLSEINIEFTLVPLIAGQVPLPHVCVTCERTKATVLEFGTFSIPRHVFVKPVSVSL